MRAIAINSNKFYIELDVTQGSILADALDNLSWEQYKQDSAELSEILGCTELLAIGLGIGPLGLIATSRPEFEKAKEKLAHELNENAGKFLIGKLDELMEEDE